MDYFAIYSWELEDGSSYPGITSEDLEGLGFAYNSEDECWEKYGEMADANTNGVPDILDSLMGIDVKDHVSHDDVGG